MALVIEEAIEVADEAICELLVGKGVEVVDAIVKISGTQVLWSRIRIP